MRKKCTFPLLPMRAHLTNKPTDLEVLFSPTAAPPGHHKRQVTAGRPEGASNSPSPVAHTPEMLMCGLSLWVALQVKLQWQFANETAPVNNLVKL